MEIPLIMSTNHLPKHIVDRFAYMFEGGNIGLEVADGWLPTLQKLCEDIDAALGEDKRGFHWSQLKEKFGAARWYWTMGPGQGRRKCVTELVDLAMEKTHQQCAVCGAPGAIDQSAHGMLTLCPAHSVEQQERLQMDRINKAPKGAGELVLYLDFDGVLQHEDVYWHQKKGPYIENRRYTLFQHAPLLEWLLAPYPAIKIVLSTSWVPAYGCANAAKRLPRSLRERVIGATFHSAMDRYNFQAKPRGMQVWDDVVRRRPGGWLALDDDYLDWPKWGLKKYIKTNPHDGISDPLVYAEIECKLADMATCIDLRGSPC